MTIEEARNKLLDDIENRIKTESKRIPALCEQAIRNNSEVDIATARNYIEKHEDKKAITQFIISSIWNYFPAKYNKVELKQ